MKKAILILLGLTVAAYADPPLQRTVDFAGSTAPMIVVYQANNRTVQWTCRNNTSLNGTGYTPFMWIAASNTASSIVTAACSWVSQTTCVFNAVLSPSSLNTNGSWIYGVGLTSNGVTTARQGTFTILADPYASGAGAIDYTIPLNWSLYSYLYTSTEGPVRFGSSWTLTTNADGSVTVTYPSGLTNGFATIAYVDVATNTTHTTLRAYADSATNAVLATAEAYTDSATNSGLSAAKSYTDSATNGAMTTVRGTGYLTASSNLDTTKLTGDLTNTIAGMVAASVTNGATKGATALQSELAFNTWTNGNTIAAGSNAVTYLGGVAIGKSAYAADGGIAIGESSTGYERGVAFGSNAWAKGSSVALGHYAIADSGGGTYLNTTEIGSGSATNEGWFHYRGYAVIDSIGNLFGPTGTFRIVNADAIQATTGTFNFATINNTNIPTQAILDAATNAADIVRTGKANNFSVLPQYNGTNIAYGESLDPSLYVTNNGAATLGLTANANINGGGYYITNALYPVYTTPYQIGFAGTVTVAVDRIWQRYDPTNTTVLVMPAPISGQVGRVSIDINAGANSFTLSNVNLTGTGTNNGTMMFYSGSTGGAWKVQSF